MHECMCVYECVCMHVCMYVYECVCMCVHVCVCMCVPVHGECACMHVYTVAWPRLKSDIFPTLLAQFTHLGMWLCLCIDMCI